jgi:predicted dehydrogenase
MKRRDFIKAGTLATGALFIPKLVHAGTKKIKLAVLGTGWWATDYLIPAAIASGQFEIVGLCDVDSVALNHAAELVVNLGQDKPKLFAAYRELYEMHGLEAVVISTPTHWHALQFIDACKTGLHVFLEKPVSYDIMEGLAMIKAQHDAGNIVQVDFPRVMYDTNNQVKNFIQSGEAGKIYQVKANINSPDFEMVEKEIPPTLDFENYCGPAPLTKYLCFPDKNTPNWRGIHDLSRGIMVDWGIHYIYNIRRILDLDVPQSVQSFGGITRNFTQDNPDYLEVLYQFGNLPVQWSHKSWDFVSPSPDRNIGVYFYGDKATVFASDRSWQIFKPEGEKITNEIPYKKTDEDDNIARIRNFIELFIEFSQAIHTGSASQITNTLEEAFKTTSTVIYGDISYRAEARLDIIRDTYGIRNNEKAQSMLKREYRSPYVHPWG